MKKILFNFVLFWLLPLLTSILSIFEKANAISKNTNDLSFFHILIQNIFVAILIIAVGYLWDGRGSYIIFFYNSIYFSILLLIAGHGFAHLSEIIKYGLTESLAFSISCYIGTEKKIKLLPAVIILLLFSAFIEILVIEGKL